MLIKKLVRIFVLVSLFTLLVVTPVLAAPPGPRGGPDVESAAVGFVGIVEALAASLTVGAGMVVLLQLMKILGIIRDRTTKNWRISIILFLAAVLYFGPQMGLPFNLAGVDGVFHSLVALGPYLIPLFVWIADSFANKVYFQTVRGLPGIGKSLSYEAKKRKQAKNKKV